MTLNLLVTPFYERMRRMCSRLTLISILGLLLWGCTGSPEKVPDIRLATDSGVVGRVRNSKGQPVEGAWVYAYRNTNSSLRGPADFGVQTNRQGQYFLDLVEGRYYLVSRWRQAGGDTGPPRAGDAWALFTGNPITISVGTPRRVNFVLQGVQPGKPMLLRSSSLSQGQTGFSGRLLNRSKQPLAGAFALAYTDTDFRRMPDYTSSIVGPDGRFQLFVPQSGLYCLAARTHTRGQPISGEPYGVLDKGSAGCVEALNGQIIDVGDILLKPYQR